MSNFLFSSYPVLVLLYLFVLFFVNELLFFILVVVLVHENDTGWFLGILLVYIMHVPGNMVIFCSNSMNMSSSA